MIVLWKLFMRFLHGWENIEKCHMMLKEMEKSLELALKSGSTTICNRSFLGPCPVTYLWLVKMGIHNDSDGGEGPTVSPIIHNCHLNRNAWVSIEYKPVHSLACALVSSESSLLEHLVSALPLLQSSVQSSSPSPERPESWAWKKPSCSQR